MIAPQIHSLPGCDVGSSPSSFLLLLLLLLRLRLVPFLPLVLFFFCLNVGGDDAVLVLVFLLLLCLNRRKGFRSGPSARAARQERPPEGGDSGRRGGRLGGRVQGEEGRRRGAGACRLRRGRSERGRLGGGTFRGGLRPEPAQRVDTGRPDDVRLFGGASGLWLGGGGGVLCVLVGSDGR